MNGLNKFTVSRDNNPNKLIRGHTCYNTLDLPEYPSFEILRERVLFGINESQGFGFA